MTADWVRRAHARTMAALRQVSLFYAVTLGFAMASLGGFAWLADEVLEQEFAGFNRAVLSWIHQSLPGWDGLALALTSLGSSDGIVSVSLLVLGWLVWRRRTPDWVAFVATILGGGALTWALKQLFKQMRPMVFTPLAVEKGYSFPSGHSTMAFCLYGFLAVWLVLEEPRALWRWLAAAPLVAIAASIALSRLYLGVHWPTDVAAGAVVATAWLAVCFAGRQWLLGRMPVALTVEPVDAPFTNNHLRE